MSSTNGSAPGRSRYAVLDCEDAPRWNGHASYWLEGLARAGETWDVFRPWAGELPSSPADYLGYVITGSHHSVNDASQAWLEPLLEFVRACADAPVAGRVLGACFGLQITARALGGQVDGNPSGRFVFGTERVSFHPAFFQQRFAGELEVATATLLSSHGEQAVELPPGARPLARSATSENEMFAIGDRFLAVQFHAELTREAMIETILPSLRENQRVTEREAEEALASLDVRLDSAPLLDVFRRFLTAPRTEES
jgi:GMP synthase (glutamine-hydrolysing)